MQLAVISNNVQSNHSFVMEAIGRLSGAVEAAGQRTVIVPAQTGRVVAPVTEEELDDFTVEHVTETHVATEDVMASPEIVTEQPQVSQPAAVKLTEEVPEEKPRKEEPKAEDTSATTESADAEGDDDEEGLSAETAALMAQFFGG
jgi:outer membrane biosynthesis protein TonB